MTHIRHKQLQIFQRTTGTICPFFLRNRTLLSVRGPACLSWNPGLVIHLISKVCQVYISGCCTHAASTSSGNKVISANVSDAMTYVNGFFSN